MLTFNNSSTCSFVRILILLFVVCCTIVHPKNILIYQAVGTVSTRLSMWPYIEALAADKGHNLTFLSPFKESDENLEPRRHPNINYYVPTKLSVLMNWEGDYKFYEARRASFQVASAFYSYMDTGLAVCQVLYSDPEFVEWVKSSQFDLVIVETASNECAYGLAHYFKAKHILYSTLPPLPHYMDQFGLPVESSSIPDVAFAFPPGTKMSFWQRLVNTLHPLLYHMKRKYWHLPAMEKITKEAGLLGLEEELPSFEDIERNVSLIFLTSHYSLEHARSLPPYVIPIGGVVSAGKKIKPMPKDVETFVNEADKGFIFISFGTIAEFTNFDDGVQQEFIRALGNFPEVRFVWSLPKGISATLPDNILATKWAPQQTVLAHPKIKAFITHAGMGSIVEAIHHSVPMILVPVLCDQDFNAESVASKGAGIRLEIVDMKEEELTHAISEILHNEKYRKGMNTLTEFFHERPMPPLESAVWWTEFILKHDDSKKFLHPPSQLLPWYVKRGLDVWATVLLFVTLTMGLGLYIVFAIAARISRLLFGINSAAPQKSSKKLKRK